MDIKLKEKVFELLSHVKKLANINNDNLNNENLLVILNYIKEYIDIAINTKVENILKNINGDKHISDNEFQKYENLIIKIEKQLRIQIRIQNEMKMHIDYLEDIREKYENLKNEYNIMYNKYNELNTKTTDVEFESLKTENLNLKEIIKLNELYHKNKEISLLQKINRLKKKMDLYSESNKQSVSSDKDGVQTITYRDDIFEKKITTHKRFLSNIDYKKTLDWSKGKIKDKFIEHRLNFKNIEFERNNSKNNSKLSGILSDNSRNKLPVVVKKIIKK